MSVETRSMRDYVLSPYKGWRDTPRRKFWRRAAIPILGLACLFYGVTFALYFPFIPAVFAIPLGIIALIVIWALPDIDTVPTGVVEVLLFCFMMAIVIWPVYLAISLPGLPWITMTRLFGIPMCVLFLVCVSGSSRFTRELGATLMPYGWVWKTLTVFSVISVLTIVLSKHFFESLQMVVIEQINWTCVFFASVFVFVRKGRANLWAALFCCSFAIIYPIVLKETHDSRLPWADHIPSFLKVNDPAFARTLAGVTREGGEYRAVGPFTTPLGLGEYCALLMPFMLYYVAQPIKLYLRVIAALCIPALFQVVLLSDSRLGLIGCMLSFATFVVLYAVFMWRARKDSFWATAIVMAYPAFAAVLFMSTLVVGRIRERVWGSGQYNDSNAGRAAQYHAGIPKVISNPIGHGAGTAADVLGYANAGGIVTIDTYYLRIALEFGVFGFITYYGMIIAASVYSARSSMDVKDRRSELMLLIPATASLWNFLIIKSVFSNDENHPLAFMMMGMVVALCYRLRQGEAATAVTAPQRLVQPMKALKAPIGGRLLRHSR